MEPADMVGFELFPWHTARIRRRLHPPASIVRDLVWQPLRELGVETVFAFGAEWSSYADQLGLASVTELRQSAAYPTKVRSRVVEVWLEPDTGVRLVTERHSGSAGPPSTKETGILRAALGEWEVGDV
jgi:hypothetical protein